MRDPYCYPDTETLRNRLGIMDDKELRVAEADYVSLNLAELAKEEADRIFDFGELCRMHYRIFRDIFDWAGKVRVINIEKMEAPLGNISIEYSDTFDIERDARAVLKDMNLYDWKHASFDETVKKFSGCMAALWKVHPFRDDGVIIGTRLEKPSKINGFALLSPIFLSHAGWREDGAVHINTYYTESQMGLCA